MKKIRIGMIGCGMMGSGHLKTLRGLPEYEITAICDIVPEKMEQLHSEGVCGNSVRDFTDYRSLLNSGLCDVVSINTPHPLHTRMSIDAFASGMHVMCDKPIAVSVSEYLEELSISSACARLWSVVSKKSSTALFSSPDGSNRSIHKTSSIPKSSNWAAEFEDTICPLDLKNISII